MPSEFMVKQWQNKAWEAISKVITPHCPHSDFKKESHPFAEYLWERMQLIDIPHTYEEYLESVMSLLHVEAEVLERAKISVRALRFSKICG